MGRESSYWPGAKEQIEQHFVLVGFDIHYVAGHRTDAEGNFYRRALEKAARIADNGFMAITPSGRILSHSHYVGDAIGGGLGAWGGLSEKEQTAALQINSAELGEFDPKQDFTPPEGTVVLKLFIRRLLRNERGALYLPEHLDFPVPVKGQWGMCSQQPARDYMWILREEWEPIMNSRAKKGDAFPFPDALTKRLLIHHRPYKST